MKKGGISGNWSLKRTRAYIAKVLDPSTQSIEKVKDGYVFIDTFIEKRYYGKTPREAVQAQNPMLMTSNCYVYGID